MSTKTTFKRVALVAVAALGFGGLSVVTAPVANAASSAFTIDHSSITVVGTPTAGRALAAFRFNVVNEIGDAANLAAGETLTVSIKQEGLPAAIVGVRTPVVGDFTFKDVMDTVLLTTDSVTQSTANGTDTLALTDGKMTSATGNCSAPGDGDRTGSYCQGVIATSTSVGVGYGTYTLTADLTTNSNNTLIQRSTMSFKVVASGVDSGAVITVATAGTLVSGGLFAQSTTNYMRATLRDANGGLIRTVDTTSASTVAPALTATLATPATATAAEAVNQALVATDTGVAAFDYAPTAGATANDGVYGLTISTYQDVVSTSLSNTAASLVRVRYGAANSTGTISVLSTPTASPSSSLRAVTGTGLYTATETTTASNAQTYNVPLTTSSVVVKITAKNSSGTALANAPITFTTTWSGHNAGDVTPVSGATGAAIVYTDSSGNASHTVTQANALTGSTAVIAIAGAATGGSLGAFGSTTIAWLTPAVSSISVSPNTAFKAVAASSVTITLTAKDQFNNALAGVVIQPSLPSTSANYTAAARATVTTGADGKATVTVTAGAAATSDAWTFTSGAATKSITASYVAALPVIATLTGYYNTDETAATYPNLFSTTAIGATTALLIERGLNYGSSIQAVTGVSTDTRNIFRITAADSAGVAVTGVPVVFTTSSAGGWMNDSCSGAVAKPVTTLTCYPDADGYIFVKTIATATGTITYTATAGAVTISQALRAGNATADSRTVKLVVSGSDVTASVVDRFGNGVADQTVQVSVTGGSLTGGSKIASYTTDASGNFGFGVEGASTVTARLTTVSDSESVAGKTGSTIIDSTVAAGVRSASATVVGTDSSSSVAQAAADAAAEATDAANAATDASNAAAEAADAATAAAQDAADAVAALSAQVASLISGLKAQLTALTNLVIKIQKKVKA